MATQQEVPVALEKLRAACLARGASGIKSFGRTFRIYDDDGNKKLTLEEFKKGLHDYGVTGVSVDEINELFNVFDTDGSGSISFDEFLVSLRPRLSAARENMIKKAFAKLDVDGSGEVTTEDLQKIYNVKNHPKYQSGEMTRKQILQEFLNNYQAGPKDEKVTYEEFYNYYCGVSASIDHDTYFDLMMRNSWGL
ncbi:hypothetical protein LSH36_283g01000 [Paralvinella palmiformis]|uniref:EF-hand domain-containing protein n=1 Tax=Paralvinella palmiformis TaxID=53620 RepID=A0AAD9JJH4_9ANNE|nr:hypothetical protein LSH36_283g01000 [Paralvinella palmiformis]